MSEPQPNPFLRPDLRSGHKVGLAVACLHISAMLYLMVGLLMFALSLGADDWAFHITFCLGLIIGIEFVVSGLRRRKFWAWVTALCIFAIYLTSLFFPLGALGLWGLLDSGSRAQFGIGGHGRRFPSQFGQTQTDRHKRPPQDDSSPVLSDPDRRIPPARPI